MQILNSIANIARHSGNIARHIAAGHFAPRHIATGHTGHNTRRIATVILIIINSQFSDYLAIFTYYPAEIINLGSGYLKM